MGYPEFAAGDAFEAKSRGQVMMLKVGEKINQISFDEGRKSLELMLRWQFEAYNKIMSALSIRGNYRSILKICEEEREKCGSHAHIQDIVPSIAFFKDSEKHALAQQDKLRKNMKQQRINGEEAQMRLECGSISHLAYPFTPKKYRNRGKDLIEPTKTLFREASCGCTLGLSRVALSSNAPEENPSKPPGVFATQNIPFAKRLVEDTTIFAASTGCPINATLNYKSIFDI